MKIGLCSDLHLEHGYNPVINPPDDIDLMIFAGDIHSGTNAFDWIEAQQFPCESLYLGGNHEFYHYEYNALLADMRARSSDKVIFLEDNVYEKGGYSFIGSTLWTDYEFHKALPVEINMANAESKLNDHRLIRFTDHMGATLWKADHAREVYLKSAEFIKEQVAKAGRDKSVVITHHGPTTQAVPPRFRGDPINGCFVSDWDNWILDHGPRLMCFGHTHWDIDIHIGDTRVVSRQHGYRNERVRNGQPPFELLVVELP